ncbi:MAG: CPBP family intramembrane metalloprotease [Streptosporangiales bacterium]|nr:CPBP family intramembrane metalloprotease [Streptosporangiales bacterium]
MRERVRRHPVGTFFALAFLLTWAVWVPRAMVTAGVFDGRPLLALGDVWTYGPAVAGLVTAILVGGRRALRETASRLVRWRVGWHWYAIVVLTPPAFTAIVIGVYAAFGRGGEIARPAVLRDGLLAALVFFVVVALTDGIGEETGWRGFALPRLLERHHPAFASLVLGVCWALWHLPLFWTESAVLYHRPFWLLLLELPAVAVLYTWVFQRTGGSALLAVLFHASQNLTALSAATAAAGAGLGPALVVVGAKWALAGAVLAADHRVDRRGDAAG